MAKAARERATPSTQKSAGASLPAVPMGNICVRRLMRRGLRNGLRSVVTEVGTEVIGLRLDGPSVELTLSDGKAIRRRSGGFVLRQSASGFAGRRQGHAGGPHALHRQSWAPLALAQIGPDDPVILVGYRPHHGRCRAGASLARSSSVPDRLVPPRASSRCRIWRRNLMPPSFLQTICRPQSANCCEPCGAKSTRRRRAGSAGGSVIDALRPQTQALWRNLPVAERRRFLRHIRPYWEVHRHRVAPTGRRAELSELLQSGQLSVSAGRITAIDADGDGIRLSVRRRNRRDVLQLRGAWLINCSGPQLDYGRIRGSANPLTVRVRTSRGRTP